MRCLISIIVPVGPIKGNLQFLESWLLNLDQPEIEVILVHDDFRDGTAEALEDISRKMSKSQCRVMTTHVASPGLARNLGIERSLGDWLVFWDCDDMGHPKELYKLICECAQNGLKMAAGGYASIDVATGQRKTKFSHSIEDLVQEPGIWRFAIHKNLIGNNRFVSAPMGEDQLFLAEIGTGSQKIHFGSDVVYEYRTGQENQLTSDRQNALKLAPVLDRLRLDIKKLNFRDPFAIGIYVKMNLTYFRAGNNKLKAKSIARFLQIATAFPKITFLTTCKTLTKRKR